MVSNGCHGRQPRPARRWRGQLRRGALWARPGGRGRSERADRRHYRIAGLRARRGSAPPRPAGRCPVAGCPVGRCPVGRCPVGRCPVGRWRAGRSRADVAAARRPGTGSVHLAGARGPHRRRRSGRRMRQCPARPRPPERSSAGGEERSCHWAHAGRQACRPALRAETWRCRARPFRLERARPRAGRRPATGTSAAPRPPVRTRCTSLAVRRRYTSLVARCRAAGGRSRLCSGRAR